MTETHEIYRVFGDTVTGVVNQLNTILGMISNRLDKMEGLRDNPAFYSSNFQYPQGGISGFLKASSTTDADYSTLGYSDLGLSTTIIDDGYLKIFDGNGTVIHQLGDEV